MEIASVLERCAICPGNKRCVQGDGPLDAAVMCIGEAPGREEDNGGRPFIGQAGREFNENYLHLAGLKRDWIYVTNTVKCRPEQNRKPRPHEAQTCARHFLPAEIATIQPTTIILMGSTATSLVPEIDLEADHGIPFRGKLFNWEGWICPMYHPASGLHDSSMMIPMLEDWEKLERWLSEGKWMWAEDKLGERDYALCRTPRELAEYFEQYGGAYPSDRDLMGLDTETHDGVRWSVQVSCQTGTGRMILAEDFDAMQCAMRSHFAGKEWVMHNAEADLWVKDWLDLKAFWYRDTMMEAYHLIQHRQGLKPLSRRLLGRKRKSWEETVTPPSKVVLADWMCKAYSTACDWKQVTERVGKRGQRIKPIVKKHAAEGDLFSIYQHMLDNPNYPADMTLWDKVRERLGQETMERLENEIGKMPARGIAHCELSTAVEYGCSDADDTLALAIEFDRMRVEFVEKLNVQEEDIDARAIRV